MSNATENWKKWEGRVVDGQFQLRQWLGGSERSAVFLTERRGQNLEKAAIKLVSADTASAEAQLSGWEKAARLSHPHLIRLFQTGRCQLDDTRLLYLVMEYAEENLSQVLPTRPLTPAESGDMLPPVVEALSYLHGAGFVHGHLRPSNILAAKEQLKLSADGLYELGEPRNGARPRSLYDAPEVATGPMTPAADVWSVGVTLIQALTQRLPAWQGTEQAGPVVPETIPEPFREIAGHCLRPDPGQRWKVSDILASLRFSPSPVPATSSPSSRTSTSVLTSAPSTPRTFRPAAENTYSKWRILVPILACLVLLVVWGGRKLIPHEDVRPQQATGEQAQSLPAKAPPSSAPAPSESAIGTKKGVSAPGAVAQRVLPNVPLSARNTIQGRVKVRVGVAVNSSGDVTAATLDSPGPSKYFAKLALQSAQRWKFTPPQIDGEPVPSKWVLQFQFGRTATEVFPLQVVR
jgi:TonB family protein